MTAPLPKHLAFDQPRQFGGLAIAPFVKAEQMPGLECLTLNSASYQSGEELISTKQSCVVNLTLWSRDTDAALTGIRTNLHRGE